MNLHTHCLSGTKVLLERYQEKLKECLRFITAAPDMSKADKCVVGLFGRRGGSGGLEANFSQTLPT